MKKTALYRPQNRLFCSALLASFASILSFAEPEYRNLPLDYTQVEYIESTGSQYINTGISSGAGVSAVLDFSPREFTGDVNIGTQPGDDSRDWRFFNYQGGSMFDVGSRRIGYNSSTILTHGNRYIISIGNAYLRISRLDGSVKWEGSNNPVTDNEIKHSTIFVFANNSASGVANYTRMVLYSLTMSDFVDGNVQLVRDFVPCVRVADGEPGLYDLVSKSFFYNPRLSPDRFLIGPAVHAPDPLYNIARITSISDITFSEATLSILLGEPSWSGDATLAVRYGTQPDVLNFSLESTVSDTPNTELSIPLLGLTPGTLWYAALEVTPTNGDPLRTIPLPFATTPEHISNRIGLYQSFVSNKGWDTSFSIADSATIGRTLGAHAAHSYATGETWPVHYANGTEGTTQWGNNTTFGYIGYMFLSGETLTIGAKMDDNVRLTIHGTRVIDQSGPTLALATYTPPEGRPGWYPIEIRVGNGSGGYGPYSGFNGLCWNTTGYTAGDTSDNWNLFMDPGDGSLLRTEPFFNPPVVHDDWTYANNAFSGIVDCDSTHEGGTLTMYAAERHGLDDPNAWTLVATQSLDASPLPQSRAFEDIELPANANLIRFYISDNLTGMTSWSRTLSLKAVVTPQVSVLSAQNIDGTSATLVGFLGRLGLPGDVTLHATLTPETTASDEDLSIVRNATGEFSIPIENLLPGTTYAYAFDALNAGNFSGITTNAFFTTPAGSTLSSNLFTTAERSVHIHAGIDLGAGSSEAAILFGPLGSEPTLYPVTITPDGTIDLDIPGLDWGHKYSYGVVVSNSVTSANGTTYSWSDSTGLLEGAISIYDTATYTWRGEANGGRDVGDWSDRSNWSSSAADDAERPGYPTDGSEARFQGSDTTIVTLSESIALERLRISGPMDITFRTDLPNITLSATSNQNTAGMKVRVAALSLLIPTGGGSHEFYVSQGGYLRWTNQFVNHEGALISLSEKSTFYHSFETSPGNRGYNLVVDDSDVRIDRWFFYSATNTATSLSTVIVKGRSPYVYGGMFQPRGAYPGTFIFSIPVGGYDIPEGRRAPVFSGNFMAEELWGSYFYTGATMELDPLSPAIKQGDRSLDQLLVDTDRFGRSQQPGPNGYRLPLIFFNNASLPEGCYFYFKDAAGNILTDPAGDPLPDVNLETARQLWVHIQSQAKTLILLR